MSNLYYEKVWLNACGNKEIGFDAFGFEIHWSEYGNERSRYGWTIDHTWPEAEWGSDSILNLQPMSYRANREKSDKMSGYITVNNKKIHYSIVPSFMYHSNQIENKIGILMIKLGGENYYIHNAFLYKKSNNEWLVAEITEIKTNNDGSLKYCFREGWKCAKIGPRKKVIPETKY